MITFGYFFVPDGADHAGLAWQAQPVQDFGLDRIGIQDHPYQHRFFHTWTRLATQTTRVRLFPNVANLPPRPP